MCVCLCVCVHVFYAQLQPSIVLVQQSSRMYICMNIAIVVICIYPFLLLHSFADLKDVEPCWVDSGSALALRWTSGLTKSVYSGALVESILKSGHYSN